MEYIFIASLGLIFGSFLSAVSFRMPRHISVAKGRSYCPKCKHTIAWYDNIPLFSFLALGGQCRYCKKQISWRYPLIESATAFIFLLLFIINAEFILFIIAILFIAIFVIDSEHQIIPDALIFIGLGVVLVSFLLRDFSGVYIHLFAGLVSATILLLIHIFTAGRGMGMGDVKFAILGGSILGLPGAIIWLFLSFITGGVVGMFLLLFGSAKLKDKIAFGPFLIIGFFLSILIGEQLLATLLA